ncbi:amidase family protein [Pseudophaeobacter sp. A-200-2]|uniref:amidase family protein n=1 Tax=Pseudophaeobacter sp. A-200-2 TaxID=3098145 RepID=UPI0034D4BB03
MIFFEEHHSARTTTVPVTERTAAALHALEGWQETGACTAITAERAMTQAAQAEDRASRGQALGSLDGISVLWKDIIDQTGQITTCGSALRKSAQPATQDAACVSLIEAAGGVSLGRTGLSEFAFSGLGINPHFGTPPSALSETVPLLPGGSSSGSAVLVAAGLADLGIGTDTSGSVRLPAALNGIFGFKPSANRYDRTGVHELSRTLDTVGTFARSFDVLRAADHILNTRPATSPDTAKTEILDLSESLGPVWDPEVTAAYQAALSRLAAVGWTVRAAHLTAVDELRALTAAEGPLVAIEARRKYADLLASDEASRIDPVIRTRLQQAPVLSDADYAGYLQKREQLIAAARAEIGDRLLAFPTVPSLRHPLPVYLNDQKAAQELNARLLGATMIGSLLDWPGLAVPLRDAAGRVEGSILLSAASGNDEGLLVQAEQLLPALTHPILNI